MDAVLAPGDVCGGNEVIRLLGAGGFAQVYEVLDRARAHRALKILDADADAKPKLRARLAQEGAALALLDHANVLRLFDAGVDGERIYLLLELVEGKSLREILHGGSGRLPVETVVRWIRQAAVGVGEAHRGGIVHRDLKPENLLVTSQEVVKVIDFGIAKLTGWGVRTTKEQKLGTALYMSPEHIRGKDPDPRMDVYALGLILYEALTGAHPICPEGGSVYEICTRQITYRPRPLRVVVPALPPQLGAAVDRAIEKDPALRYPDAVAFADALHVVLRAVGETRLAVLRNAAVGLSSLPGRTGAPAVATLPMKATGLAPTQPLMLPAKTEPLDGAAEDTGRGSITAPPTVRAAPVARPSDPAARVVVVVAVALGLACGVGLVLWVIPWPL